MRPHPVISSKELFGIMTIWRPAQRIHAKVIGLVWYEARLLAAEVTTDNGKVKGVRPPGGLIEFGETREQALAREFREELGCDIAILSSWITLENLYEHEGALGHEFVFAANVRLMDPSYYHRREVRLIEHDNTVWIARWFDLNDLPEAVDLYRHGLAEQLAAMA